MDPNVAGLPETMTAKVAASAAESLTSPASSSKTPPGSSNKSRVAQAWKQGGKVHAAFLASQAETSRGSVYVDGRIHCYMCDLVKRSWNDYPQATSLWGNILYLNFVGLRLLHEDRAKPTHTALKDLRKMKDPKSHICEAVGLLIICGHIYNYVNDGFESDGVCPDNGMHLLTETKTASLICTVWALCNLFVFLAAGRPHRPMLEARVSWRTMLILENLAWLFFMMGDLLMRLLILVSHEQNRSFSAVVSYFGHCHRMLNLFFTMAPALAFNMTPQDNPLSELLFTILTGYFLSYSMHKVLWLSVCSGDLLVFMNEIVGFHPSILFLALAHFHSTHRFCIMLMVFTRNHIQGDVHALPDIMTVMSIFTPIKSRVSVYRILGCIFILLLALATPYVFEHLLCTTCVADPSVYFFGILLDVPFIVFVTYMYWTCKRSRHPASWEAQIIVLTGVVGVGYMMTEFPRQPALAFKAFCVVQGLARFLAALFAADVFSRRLTLPENWKFMVWPFFYAVVTLAAVTINECEHKFHEGEVGAHHRRLFSLLGGDASQSTSGRISGSISGSSSSGGSDDSHGHGHGQEDGGGLAINNHTFLMIGEFALIESALIQSIGWLVELLELFEPGATEDEPPVLKSQRVLARVRKTLVAVRASRQKAEAARTKSLALAPLADDAETSPRDAATDVDHDRASHVPAVVRFEASGAGDAEPEQPAGKQRDLEPRRTIRPIPQATSALAQWKAARARALVIARLRENRVEQEEVEISEDIEGRRADGEVQMRRIECSESQFLD